jgi:hypothetical protein
VKPTNEYFSCASRITSFFAEIKANNARELLLDLVNEALGGGSGCEKDSGDCGLMIEFPNVNSAKLQRDRLYPR